MKRLTKKEIVGDIPIYSYGDINLDGFNVWGIPTQKLGQLEDIEEELGIDLITLFKALTNGELWFITEEGTEKLYSDEFSFHYDDLYSPNSFSKDQYPNECLYIKTSSLADYLVKDYGKSWALTKKELENEHL